MKLTDFYTEADSVSVRTFVDEHYRHFNAGTVQRTCVSLSGLLTSGGRVFLTLAGAMSTAEIGRTLAPMIRAGHIAAISCTGANLEEDVFNLVAKDHYEQVVNHEDLSPMDDHALLQRHLNRVTDTCIPEEEAIRTLEGHLMTRWRLVDQDNARLPHTFLYDLLNSGDLADAYQGDPAHSWLLAAAEVNLPLYVPGWEDSTLGNIFAARAVEGVLNADGVLGGVHYMKHLVEFYRSNNDPLAFLQVGGGIAGDFPICVVPLLHQDLQTPVPLWSWFAQITDATASYGGYSGAPPNEKISWGKLGVDTPRFNIHSDATIVLPLVFGYVLDLA
ncbi:MAG: deoxyhypusine synthase family protein [Flavobacteriales bacterium]|nr:deoxyhypusine synthase family protein [Flavobacteriales bacterium]